MLNIAADAKSEQSSERGRLWEVSTDPLGILNAQGYFESTNPAWTTTLGWTSNAILETSIYESIHPNDVEETRIRWLVGATRERDVSGHETFTHDRVCAVPNICPDMQI
jgi:PAS domain S-box-containing protein